MKGHGQTHPSAGTCLRVRALPALHMSVAPRSSGPLALAIDTAGSSSLILSRSDGPGCNALRCNTTTTPHASQAQYRPSRLQQASTVGLIDTSLFATTTVSFARIVSCEDGETMFERTRVPIPNFQNIPSATVCFPDSHMGKGSTAPLARTVPSHSN